MVRNNGSLINM